jgi:hypothetical protein
MAEIENSIIPDGADDASEPITEAVVRDAQLRAAALFMKASLAEFMAAQIDTDVTTESVYKPAVSSPKKFSSDPMFFERPVEILANGTARAVAKMHYNLRWSSAVIHSADMMFSAGGVVEALLEDGEDVTGVQSLRFLNPVQNNVEMFAYVGDDSEEVASRCVEKKPDLKAVFLTKNSKTGAERKIQLFGFQNRQDASLNEAFYDMACLPASLSKFDVINLMSDGSGNNIFGFNLTKPAFSVFETKVGSVLNTVMELVMWACVELRETEISPFPPGTFNLAYNFDFKKLPAVEELDEKCELMLLVNRGGIVERPNGFRLIPVLFSIRKDGKFICEGVYTSAQPADAQVASDYQGRL